MPMACPPVEWIDYKYGGYLNNNHLEKALNE